MTIRNQYTVVITILSIAIISLLGIGLATLHAEGTPERVIVTFEHETNEDVRAELQNAGHIIKELPIVNSLVVLVPERAIPHITALSGIKSVEKDARVFALHHRSGHDGGPGGGGDDGTGESNQPSQELEWGVDRIDANLAWETSRGAGIRVAVIDTGIDQDHEDLVANIKGGINFVGKGPAWKQANPSKWDDDNGHGTHVAGIIAAADNTIGVIGTAPEAQLYGVKVLDRNGSGYVSDVIDGITWAIENDMDVVNMSLGSSSDVQALHDAVDAASNAGLVLVAAAGNSGDGNGSTNEVSYPARYSSVIAIAATDTNDNTPTWSSEGEEVEFSAPGVSIRSTWNDGLYNTISGTSMASPHVAGVVALMLGTAISGDFDSNNDGAWGPDEVRTALKVTADDLGTTGQDNFYGHGLVDAEESTTGNETN